MGSAWGRPHRQPTAGAHRGGKTVEISQLRECSLFQLQARETRHFAGAEIHATDDEQRNLHNTNNFFQLESQARLQLAPQLP